jgi:hypothetical protein
MNDQVMDYSRRERHPHIPSYATPVYIFPIIIIVGVVGNIFGWGTVAVFSVIMLASYPFYVLYWHKENRKQRRLEAS